MQDVPDEFDAGASRWSQIGLQSWLGGRAHGRRPKTHPVTKLMFPYPPGLEKKTGGCGSGPSCCLYVVA